MLRNYLTIAIRNLMKQKTFTLINVFGLAIGVACCMILGLYVHYETSYDRHHPNAEHIYRVVREDIDVSGNRSFKSGTSGALTKLLRNDVPGVRTSVRMRRSSFWARTDTQEFRQTFCLADPEILSVFDLPLLRGNRQTVFEAPNSALVTERVAQKYFGKADPIGKVIRLETSPKDEYTITGVLKDLPQKSLLRFHFLISNASFAPKWGWDTWRVGVRWMPLETYVLLEENARPKDIEQQLVSLVPRYAGEEARGKIRHHLQPIVRTHLYGKQDYGFSPRGDIRRLYVAAILGFFILLLAGINFVNLSTARSTMRAKEVGMRKVVGAHRRQIVGQFLGESILLSIFAHLFALAMVHLSLPWLSSWIGISLSITQAGFWFLLTLPGSVLIIGLLAGSCPAFFISKFRPIAALKGVKNAGGTSLRRSLVLFQFSISVVLIAGTWVVFSQWQFMVGKDPGYEKENVVLLPIFKADPSLAYSKSEEVRQRFLKHPNILFACVTNETPDRTNSRHQVRPEGETEDRHMYHFDLDEDVLNVFGIELIQGRDFSTDIQSDGQVAYILNEAAVKAFGWKDPIGKTFQALGWRKAGRVIGVVKDFHFQSLQEKIKPLLLRRHSGQRYLSLRIGSKNLAETMAFIQKTWKDLTNRPFDYSFLDQRLEAVYRADMKAGQMFSAAAALAILIACLGLVGLASFSTQQRTKEIGIRKVLGATMPNLVALFTRDFIKLVTLANLLMMPVSIYLTQMWLDQFAYRITLGPWPFVISATLSLLIAALTVSLIAFRATAKNPVDALRSE